jgi:hypothetical protein
MFEETSRSFHVRSFCKAFHPKASVQSKPLSSRHPSSVDKNLPVHNTDPSQFKRIRIELYKTMEIRPNAKKINKILADLLENTLISSYLITILNKNSSKLSTAPLPRKA